MLHFLRSAGPLAFLLLAAVVLPGVARAASTPTSPPDSPLVPRSAGAEPDERLTERVSPLSLTVHGSVFDTAQVVSLYGYPGVPAMGVLGKYNPLDAVDEAVRIAEGYDSINGDRDVMPALHLIVAVAQRSPMDDGTYIDRLSEEAISVYVDIARARGVLLFLDVQVGWADPVSEVRLLSGPLSEPFVHLALDPEFATRSSGRAPGIAIGSLDAVEINAVQSYLAELVQEHRLPTKLLVLHQFVGRMLLRTDEYTDLSEVELTIDMDGYGSAWAKLKNYESFALAPYAERAGIKLFYNWDTPLMAPEQLLGLERPPDLVIYQ